MAEGLQEASRAFQTEIAPASSQPRDQTGRFVQTSERPEPMFQPRPIEGDPLTGDVRDGGEDARLAERERRIADGRSEEGDEQAAARSRRAPADETGAGRERVSADDEGAGHAAADEGHEGAEEEQGVRAEGEPEHEEDEVGFKVTTKDGEPVSKFEVTVDGQPQQVSLDEALRGYIREATFHQRMNKVAEARQAVEAEAGAVGQMRDALHQRIAYLDRMLAELVPAEPNWDAEFAANPAQAREKQKAYGAIYQKRQEIANAMAYSQQEAQADHERRARDYAIQGFSKFVQDANIPDEKTLQTELADMRSYGKSIGFSEGELATVYDPRMLRVLRDATKYRQAMARTPKAVVPGKGKTLTPGVATPVGNATRRSIDDAQQKLARTGRLADAEAVFARMLRR